MNLYKQVQDQIKRSFDFIKQDYDVFLLEKLLRPDQVFEFPLTIKMDNGSVETFFGYRSQHNCIKGPYKWWIRFHPNVNKDEVMSLSAWMSIKTSAVWIPLGGWKWWIAVDPKKLSMVELEKLSREYMKKLYKFIWPNVDVPAPDVNTNWQIMSRMVDEYSKLVWVWSPGVITWKPLTIWWSKWREIATSLWWLFVLEQFLELHKDSLKNKKIVIQWAGNVWLNFAVLLQDTGARLIWISDSKWWIYNKSWLDIEKIEKLKKEWKSVCDYEDADFVTNEELLLLDCDVLVPSALENVITKQNAHQIKWNIILELANGPVDAEWDNILATNGKVVIPDILANAWWVTVSYFEQVQNNMNYYRSEEEVYQKLENIIKPSTIQVVENSKKYNTTLRNGAYIVSMKRILDAMKIRN